MHSVTQGCPILINYTRGLPALSVRNFHTSIILLTPRKPTFLKDTYRTDSIYSMCTGKLQNCSCNQVHCRSQWPRGLRRRSAAARLLRWWVRIPPGAWICECCVLSGRGLCDELITRPEESYRLWCVAVCDLETSRMRRP